MNAKGGGDDGGGGGAERAAASAVGASAVGACAGNPLCGGASLECALPDQPAEFKEAASISLRPSTRGTKFTQLPHLSRKGTYHGVRSRLLAGERHALIYRWRPVVTARGAAAAAAGAAQGQEVEEAPAAAAAAAARRRPDHRRLDTLPSACRSSSFSSACDRSSTRSSHPRSSRPTCRSRRAPSYLRR